MRPIWVLPGIGPIALCWNSEAQRNPHGVRYLNRTPTPPLPATAQPAAVRPPGQIVPAAPAGLAVGAGLLTILYVLIVYGRLPEILIPIPMLAFAVAVPALGLTLITGGLLRAGQTSAGKMLLLLTAWLILCIPFSEWPGGSFNLIVRQMWLKSVALYFIIAGNIVTFHQYRKLIYSIALSLLLIVAGTAVWGAARMGRLSAGEGLLGNPNDFAVHLLVAAPFLYFILQTRGLASFRGLLALGVLAGVLLLVLKTGSRAGLLTMVAFLGYQFFRGTLRTKIMLTVAALAGLAILPAVVPQEAWVRYLTIFSDVDQSEYDTRQVEFAQGSKEARIELLKESIRMTFYNPVFGVGPGMFSQASAEKMEAAGQRARWSQTHNSFTQMASESGILAGVLYAALVLLAIRRGWSLNRLARRNPGAKEFGIAADVLAQSTVCFVAGAFFGNYAYMMYMPLLVGCAESLHQIAARELLVQGSSRVKPRISPRRAGLR